MTRLSHRPCNVLFKTEIFQFLYQKQWRIPSKMVEMVELKELWPSQMPMAWRPVATKISSLSQIKWPRNHPLDSSNKPIKITRIMKIKTLKSTKTTKDAHNSNKTWTLIAHSSQIWSVRITIQRKLGIRNFLKRSWVKSSRVKFLIINYSLFWVARSQAANIMIQKAVAPDKLSCWSLICRPESTIKNPSVKIKGNTN